MYGKAGSERKDRVIMDMGANLPSPKYAFAPEPSRYIACGARVGPEPERREPEHEPMSAYLPFLK